MTLTTSTRLRLRAARPGWVRWGMAIAASVAMLVGTVLFLNWSLIGLALFLIGTLVMRRVAPTLAPAQPLSGRAGPQAAADHALDDDFEFDHHEFQLTAMVDPSDFGPNYDPYALYRVYDLYGVDDPFEFAHHDRQ